VRGAEAQQQPAALLPNATIIAGCWSEQEWDASDTSEPVRLVGWTAVTVAPGGTETARVAIDRRACRRWDEANGAWARVAGGSELVLARGLGDIRGRVHFPELR
jgi:hypothetical protein